MPNRYFDLHVHAIVKNFLTKFDAELPANRSLTGLYEDVELSRKFIRLADEVAVHLLASQASFRQLNDGRLGVGVAAIAPLELGYAGSQGIFGKLLRSKLTEPLSQRYFQRINAGEISYLNLFLREVSMYLRLAELQDKNNPIIRFITRKDNEVKLDDDVPGIILSIEGGHALCGLKVGKTTEIDPLDEFDEDKTLFKKVTSNGTLGKPVANLKVLFESIWEAGMDILYLTLTHLTHISEQYLATHAYGLKLIKHPAFYPSGSGISDLGREVIDAAYTLNMAGKLRPVLIDIKHMSLQSRLDFYAYRKAQKYSTKYPIIASHMGVTGYSIDEWKDALNQEQLRHNYDQGVRTIKVQTVRKTAGKWGAINNEFTFNPWSINLMDEDIVEILHSGGLIGLNLDVRILGFQSLIGPSSKDTPEYLSTAEFATHFPEIETQTISRTSAEVIRQEEESWLVPTKEDRHPLCLCFNIVHIHCVGVLKAGHEKPLQQVCLGTDLDGLIEPLKVCRSFESMDNLRYHLFKWLPIAAKAYQEENGGADYLYEAFTKRDSLDESVQAVLYKSGQSFITRWLNGKFE